MERTPISQVAIVDFAATQAQVSKERRKKLPTLPLVPLSGLSGTKKYNRFVLSPISSEAFPTKLSPESETIPFRNSLLERYLIEGAHPPTPDERVLTLATSGIADALPTPGIPENLWACLGDDMPVQYKFPKPPSAKIDTANLNDEGNDANVTIPLRGLGNPRRTDDHKSTHTSNVAPKSVMSMLLYQNTQIEARARFTMDDSGLATPPPAPFPQNFADQLPEIPISVGSSPFDPPPAPRSDHFPGYYPASPKFSGPSPLDTSLKISRKKDLSSAMNSPVLPEDRAHAVLRSLYPPPAPTSEEFSENTPVSPVESEPAPTTTFISSPNSSLSHASTPPKLTQTAPQPPPMSHELPRTSTRPKPITINKSVRFADLKSPAHGNLKSPGYYGHLAQSPSPALFSPLTPLAMFCTFPSIVSVSPPMQANEFYDIEEDQFVLRKDDAQLTSTVERGRSSARDSGEEQHRARTLSPPRSRTLLVSNKVEASLPATVYDSTVVYDAKTNTRTLVYPVPVIVDAKSNSSARITDNDKNRILRAYFNRARSST